MFTSMLKLHYHSEYDSIPDLIRIMLDYMCCFIFSIRPFAEFSIFSRLSRVEYVDISRALLAFFSAFRNIPLL